MIPSEAWTLSNSLKVREKLVEFWLHAPSDQLESIWKSPIGYTTSSLIKCLDNNFDFTPDQIATRNALGSFRCKWFEPSLSAQIMIANFCFLLGLLTVNNIDQFFPVGFAMRTKSFTRIQGIVLDESSAVFRIKQTLLRFLRFKCKPRKTNEDLNQTGPSRELWMNYCRIVSFE